AATQSAAASNERRRRGPSTYVMPAPRATGDPLFPHHADPDFGADVGVDLDAYPKLAQRADRLGEVHLALVDVDPELLELALDVARGDRAEQLVLLADLDGERQADVGKLSRFGLGGGLLRGALLGEPLRLVNDPFLIGLGCEVGEPLRQELVAGV